MRDKNSEKAIERLKEALDAGSGTAAATRLRAAVEFGSPPGSTYRQQTQEIAGMNQYAPNWKEGQLRGVARGLLADLESGYGASLTDLVRAEVTSDYLGMADELLGQKFDLPAAVVIGTVLEGQLRKLAESTGIPTHKGSGENVKADTLNAELKKAEVYNGLTQKNVTAWLDLRNKAAHGDHEDFNQQQVELMRQGVGMFLSEHP